MWCTFPCQQLRTSFGLPTIESLVKWAKEIDYKGWYNSHQVRAWVENWTTVVSVAPAVLADLSCRLNVGAATRLDGREKNSTVCIRFLHLRGQKPTQIKNATLELQKGCFQLALEIKKICWPDARKLENSDLEIAFLTSTGGRMEGRILLANCNCFTCRRIRKTGAAPIDSRPAKGYRGREDANQCGAHSRASSFERHSACRP